MVIGAVQLALDRALPLDPAGLAGLTAVERRRLYDELGLDHFQREASEEAVRRVLAGEYRRRSD